jgi:hypothetical protein
MKRATVIDERDRNWVIYESDPAWALCSVLTKIGVREIVLPSTTLLTGHLVEMQYEQFDTKPADHIRQFPNGAAAVRRQIRLQDCVEFLLRCSQARQVGCQRDDLIRTRSGLAMSNAF